MTKKKGRFSGETIAGFGAAFATLILIGIFYVHGRWSSKDRDENGPGNIERSSWVTLADGTPAVLLSESIAHGDEHSDWKIWRISLLSIDGSLRARRVADQDPISCAAAGRGRAWCDFGKGKLELLDLPKFSSVPLPTVVGEVHNDEGVQRNGGALKITTKDGYKVLIDPTSLEQKKLEVGAPDDHGSYRSLGSSQSATATDARFGTTTIGFEGYPRARLALRPDGQRAQPFGDLSFIKPQFVHDDDEKRTVMVADGKAAIVVSTTSLDDKQAKMLLTAVTVEGKKLWEIEEKPGTVISARVFERTLMVVLSHFAYLVLGIDQATGRVLYRYDGVRGKK